ncbi:unnamed protein product (macronuclear) [Paramecium tetraurelia]|uniref:Uncharacterized protein n=1 Tax=Paramecium tetraurelia TaxID=5888 RepID=A0BT08_PARTE|nr:uncharacterized protein GSPATT00031907001 [Paramecium tetraurelia]CAK61675.1 unnamed protein product [Paramecium tetraurelia]|eukprot:XP_001429073.1 hypothetical protein (macronuclear) [Paramecium tetraurelia strain d4-2]
MKHTKEYQISKENLKIIRQSELIQNTVVWTNKNLFLRYCQSQNYYYIRDVNEILADASSKAVIRYKDWHGYDDDDEYLKRYYYTDEYPQKVHLLTEYYKFHTDIARLYMEPIATLLNKYFDKKRKYEYYRIAHLIEEENKKNPNRPPKGIVGERPSPANSQETQKEEESPTTARRIRNIEILKDLSWLNKSRLFNKQKIDISCTLQDICKHLGNQAFEQSSLFIQTGKTEELKLNKFLAYVNQQVKKTSNKIDSQHLKPNKKLSQPQEQLIQTLIQKQQEESKSRLGSQHSKQNTELLLQMNKLSKDFNLNFVRNQVDSLFKNNQSKENPQSLTRINQNEQIKQSANPKSKTIIQHQPKISTQLFLKELKKNVQSIPQLLSKYNTSNIPSPTTSSHNRVAASNQPNIGKLNLKQISKIQIEEDPTEQEVKLKCGSQTHRPHSGTQNFFSNRNSPTISRAAQNDLKINKIKQAPTTSLQQVNPNPKANKQSGSSTNRKSSQPNIHIRYTSNQDKNYKNVFVTKYSLEQQQKHKKNQYEGKPLQLNTNLPDTQQEYVCLTDRGGASEFLFKNSIAASCQNSPKTQKIKRINSGTTTLKCSMSTKNSLIQQMISQVSKQQQKQEVLSSQFRKPN